MIRKEFLQLSHNWAVLILVVWSFTGGVITAGRAQISDVKDYPMIVLDEARSPASRDLVTRLGSPHFKLIGYVDRDAAVRSCLDEGCATLALVIPEDFERRLSEGNASVQVIIDGTQSLQATIASSYVAAIANQLGIDVLQGALGRRGGATSTRLGTIDARVRVAFNPNLDGSWLGSLLELFNSITTISMLLTAAAAVREREHGTLEQLLVSPLRPAELFFAKIVPALVLVPLIGAASMYGIVHGVLGTPLRGSVGLVLAVTVLYTFVTACIGLAVAVGARSMSQAMLLLFLTLMPMMFLSGGMAPTETMTPIMRSLTLISPMRYYIHLGLEVLLRGNGLEIVWSDLVGLCVVGSIAFGFAVWRFDAARHA
jgi:ABC-2 type transport system permease protein